MREEIAFENGRISDFQALVTLNLTLDRVILHTVMHHSSTSTYIPNFIEIKETFCKRTDGHLRPTLLGRLEAFDLETAAVQLTIDNQCQHLAVAALSETDLVIRRKAVMQGNVEAQQVLCGQRHIMSSQRHCT